MAFWHWLVLAVAFAVIEIAVPAMVCIWLAAAALGAAAIAWLAPVAVWEYQALIFAALAVAGVAIGRVAFARTRVRAGSVSIGAQRSMSAGHSPSSARSSMAAGGLESTTRCGSSKDPISRPGRGYR
jgi:hypothetical protein